MKRKLGPYKGKNRHKFTGLEVRRFWARVDKNGPIQPHCPELGPCWVWSASRQTRGQGAIRIGGKQWNTSRFSWELNRGPIPKGMLICHKCDFRPCVNPRHLYLGTHRTNGADAARRFRHLKLELQPDFSPFQIKLRTWRWNNKLTQAGAAERLGIRCSNYEHWEQGVQEPAGFAMTALLAKINAK